LQEPSVSLNVWSQASEYEALETLFALPIPFEEHWEPEKMVCASLSGVCLLNSSELTFFLRHQRLAVRVFLWALIDRIKHQANTFKSLWDNQWYQLLGRNPEQTSCGQVLSVCLC
jgi:hypothetical protein